ncbi:hypothetical protein FSP39_001893 [Pinctada imbricata]|uniref:cellulase n=1 Tax=Pinctada imbricata TaxID=66713 RepID=A0AA88YGI9_PINIB|nr:hypothetical protein FSP39_001893 [Pinctada imbricata]
MLLPWTRTMLYLVTIVCFLHFCHGDDTVVQMSNVQNWGWGRFQGVFSFPIKGEEVQGWEVILNFSSPVTGLMEWMGDIIKSSKDNKEYVIVNKQHNALQHNGQTLSILVQGSSSSGSVPHATGKLINMAHDGFTWDGTKYNYNDVLHKSILFYEAQRSGKLPPYNEIPWRGDSALNDSGRDGEDLTGGWYDGSNKFGFPMAASTTLLGWGLLQYQDAYHAAGLLDKMYDCMRWPLEWMIKCHTGPNELYVQIGDPNTDYNVWQRPEDMTIARPAYKIDSKHPGSDIAGEYAAAMAVGYLVFKEKDPIFARSLLDHAKQINEFALNYKGKFSDSIHACQWILQDWMGDIIKHSHENQEYILVNKPNNAIQHKGSTIDIMVQGTSDSGSPPCAIGKLINMGHDDYSVPTLPDKDATKYNYNDVLHKSIMFYEAQRSGKLPADNEISWRGDSALNDSGINGEDLTGGWYDGAGSTKFGFPMSASTTLLGWGLLQYKDAYQAAGLLDKMYDCIRWPLEWMLKCRTGPNELYIQVGDESEDHNHWERPESLKIARPAKKIDASHPGSDVAGEYAAAMTVGYLVFKEKDPSFAQNLLKNAEKINEFAESFHGRYSDSLTTGNSNYKSSSYHDELSWAGAWLYRATNQSKYLQQAETYYKQGTSWAMSWDDKSTGVAILLHNITGKEMYKQDVEATLQNWMPGGGVLYSPKGLAHRDKWGPLRYASNMAFMALLAADDGLHVDYYRKWATSQIHYALGDTGRSYVCGFGINPPTQPYHKGSSCPLDPVPCGFNIYRSRGPNPHVLYGALVSGPDNGDNFRNIRSNSMNSNVACDYNAGFQSAVAGNLSL